MKSKFVLNLVLLFAINAFANEPTTTQAWEVTKSVSPELAKVIADLGNKCGVDATQASQQWITMAHSGYGNDKKVRYAVSALKAGNAQQYSEQVNQMTCP